MFENFKNTNQDDHPGTVVLDTAERLGRWNHTGDCHVTLAQRNEYIDDVGLCQEHTLFIINLDLTKIVKKVKAKSEWTDAEAVQAEMQYKQFLIMCLKYPKIVHVPSRMIDEVWHAHILDTKRYMQDCKAILGRFLHHVPSYGEECEKSEAYAQQFDELWHKEFGTYLFKGVKHEKKECVEGCLCANVQAHECRSECKDCRTGGSCQDAD